jgi:hypothetical protein
MKWQAGWLKVLRVIEKARRCLPRRYVLSGVIEQKMIREKRLLII